jgi:hypothetical protein
LIWSHIYLARSIHQIPECTHFFDTCHMSCQSQSSWFDHTNIWPGLFIQSLYAPLFSKRGTCLANLGLLDLIKRIFGKECKSVMSVCVCVCVCGALGEWCWQGKAKIIGANPVPVTRCPLQIPNGLTWDWTWSSNVKSPMTDRLKHGAALNLCSGFNWLRIQPSSRLCFLLMKLQGIWR